MSREGGFLSHISFTIFDSAVSGACMCPGRIADEPSRILSYNEEQIHARWDDPAKNHTDHAILAPLSHWKEAAPQYYEVQKFRVESQQSPRRQTRTIRHRRRVEPLTARRLACAVRTPMILTTLARLRLLGRRLYHLLDGAWPSTSVAAITNAKLHKMSVGHLVRIIGNLPPNIQWQQRYPRSPPLRQITPANSQSAHPTLPASNRRIRISIPHRLAPCGKGPAAGRE